MQNYCLPWPFFDRCFIVSSGSFTPGHMARRHSLYRVSLSETRFCIFLCRVESLQSCPIYGVMVVADSAERLKLRGRYARGPLGEGCAFNKFILYEL